MKFNEFTKLFPDEDSCIKYFRELKESRGIVCPHCGSTQFYWSNLYKSNHMIANNVPSGSHYVVAQ